VQLRAGTLGPLPPYGAQGPRLALSASVATAVFNREHTRVRARLCCAPILSEGTVLTRNCCASLAGGTMENGNGEHAAVHIPAEALPRRMSNVEVTLSWKARSGHSKSGTNHAPTVVVSCSLGALRHAVSCRSAAPLSATCFIPPALTRARTLAWPGLGGECR